MLVMIRKIEIINCLLSFHMQECKGLSDENGWTDFCNHVELFTGINNRFVYEYLNGVLV